MLLTNTIYSSGVFLTFLKIEDVILLGLKTFERQNFDYYLFLWINFLHVHIATITVLVLAHVHILVVPQIMAQTFISFQQLFTLAIKRDRWLYETGDY